MVKRFTQNALTSAADRGHDRADVTWSSISTRPAARWPYNGAVSFKQRWPQAMRSERQSGEFPEQAEENRRLWDVNARWWDDRIGDGNDFQTLLIEPATERLLDVLAGDTILDAACGAGRFARRMAELGARVVAFDHSAEFIARARERPAMRRSSTTSLTPPMRRPSCPLVRTDSTRQFAPWPSLTSPKSAPCS